ncbi:hypothetical protein HYQ44_013463 [Verticillium longisporum]|nr:hypothetical protein HYQ44_013463 [Verticillium longisporum]
MLYPRVRLSRCRMRSKPPTRDEPTTIVVTVVITATPEAETVTRTSTSILTTTPSTTTSPKPRSQPRRRRHLPRRPRITVQLGSTPALPVREEAAAAPVATAQQSTALRRPLRPSQRTAQPLSCRSQTRGTPLTRRPLRPAPADGSCAVTREVLLPAVARAGSSAGRRAALLHLPLRRARFRRCFRRPRVGQGITGCA